MVPCDALPALEGGSHWTLFGCWAKGLLSFVWGLGLAGTGMRELQDH